MQHVQLQPAAAACSLTAVFHESTLHKSTGRHWCTRRRILGDLEPPPLGGPPTKVTRRSVSFIGRLFPTLSRCDGAAPGAQPHGEAKVHPWSSPTRNQKGRELDGWLPPAGAPGDTAVVVWV